MKFTSKTLLVVSLLISQHVLANSPAVCPDVSTIKMNATFIQAKDCSVYDKDAWCMVSKPFVHQSETWNVTMMVKVKANSAEEAIAAGNFAFKTKVNLNEPEREKMGNSTICSYGEVEGSYSVAAFNPPLSIDKIPSGFKTLK